MKAAEAGARKVRVRSFLPTAPEIMMAIIKGKADAGQGGKIGHSNQNHWGPTEEVKDAARKWRRLQAKSEIAAGLSEFEPTDEPEQYKPGVNDELPQ
jgi:hypothetical protein